MPRLCRAVMYTFKPRSSPKSAPLACRLHPYLHEGTWWREWEISCSLLCPLCHFFLIFSHHSFHKQANKPKKATYAFLSQNIKNHYAYSCTQIDPCRGHPSQWQTHLASIGNLTTQHCLHWLETASLVFPFAKSIPQSFTEESCRVSLGTLKWIWIKSQKHNLLSAWYLEQLLLHMAFLFCLYFFKLMKIQLIIFQA